MVKAKCKEKDTAMFIIASPVVTQNDVYHKINDVTNVPVTSRLKQDYTCNAKRVDKHVAK